MAAVVGPQLACLAFSVIQEVVSLSWNALQSGLLQAALPLLAAALSLLALNHGAPEGHRIMATRRELASFAFVVLVICAAFGLLYTFVVLRATGVHLLFLLALSLIRVALTLLNLLLVSAFARLPRVSLEFRLVFMLGCHVLVQLKVRVPRRGGEGAVGGPPVVLLYYFCCCRFKGAPPLCRGSGKGSLPHSCVTPAVMAVGFVFHCK